MFSNELFFVAIAFSLFEVSVHFVFTKFFRLKTLSYIEMLFDSSLFYCIKYVGVFISNKLKFDKFYYKSKFLQVGFC